MTVSRPIPELLSELTSQFRAWAADPAYEVTQLELGPPAPPELVARRRGEWPDDILDVWAHHNGIRFAWRSRHERNLWGGFHMPPLSRNTDFEWGFPSGAFLPLDEEGGFAACYWSENGAPPFEVAFVERGNETNSLWDVCTTFAEYLELGLAHNFAGQWPIRASLKQ